MISGRMKLYAYGAIFGLLITTLNCATDRVRYQYQRTVPGADGTIYVQGLKVQQKMFLFNSMTPVIWNCKLRGEDLKCDRELQLNIDSKYWQGPEYFQKDFKP